MLSTQKPAWSIPSLDMTDEQLRFAVAAEEIFECLKLGLTAEQYMDGFKPDYQLQALTDWQTVAQRLAEEKKSHAN